MSHPGEVTTFAFRDTRHGDPGGMTVEVAVTGRGVDLGDAQGEAALARALRAVAAATGAQPVVMRQVHGREVSVDPVPAAAPPRADALVTSRPGVALVTRAADCVPVLLADPRAGVVAAVHAGRAGLAAGVVPAALSRVAAVGAGPVVAWVGPHICGRCYEVPEALREEVAARVPQAWGETSWGTATLDLGAGVRAQLEREGVSVVDVSRCTRESADLYSYRRDGAAAGRLAGLVRIGAAA